MKLYVLTRIVDLSIAWEPVDEGEVELIGVFDNKDKIEKYLEENGLNKDEIDITEVELNKGLNDKTLFGWNFYNSDMYDDNFDI